jgi:hypothetical protein
MSDDERIQFAKNHAEAVLGLLGLYDVRISNDVCYIEATKSYQALHRCCMASFPMNAHTEFERAVEMAVADLRDLMHLEILDAIGNDQWRRLTQR